MDSKRRRTHKTAQRSRGRRRTKTAKYRKAWKKKYAENFSKMESNQNYSYIG